LTLQSWRRFSPVAFRSYRVTSVRTKDPRILLANITRTPRITIFTADLVADCFRVTPRNAPSKKSRMTPMIMDAVTADVSGKSTRGTSNASEARAEVMAVTIPEPNALRLIFPNSRWTFGCSVVINEGFFLVPLVCLARWRFVCLIASSNWVFFSCVSDR